MKKKSILIGTILIVILAAVILGRPLVAQGRKTAAQQTISLARTDLVDSVLVSGTVISSNSKKVYSKLSAYTVKEVHVKVGDRVKAGDLLAELDTSSLELDIRQTELNIKNAQASLDNEASTNQSGLQNALNGVESSSIELENAQRNYDEAKKLFDAGSSSQQELTQAESSLKKARIAYDNAQITLKNNRNKSTASTRTNLEVQKITLEKQKKSLSDARITAPIDGTITLVNAAAGESSAGLLFVVEDTDNLIVSTAIGEFDLALVKIGQEVAIKTDGTGDRHYTGTITGIAPTAAKTAAGDTASSSDVRFDTEITVKDKDDSLKIGMTARLTIKLGERKNVYAVPYDAIVTEKDGNEYLYVLDSSQTSKRAVEAVKKLQIQTGMETDMYVEVSGTELTDDLQILTNPQVGARAAAGEARP